VLDKLLFNLCHPYRITYYLGPFLYGHTSNIACAFSVTLRACLVAQPSSDILNSTEILVFVSPVRASGQCPPRPKTASQPCPVEKLDSSFAGGQGSTRPRRCPRAPRPRPRPQGSQTPTPISPYPTLSLTSAETLPPHRRRSIRPSPTAPAAARRLPPPS
jgi:hypothetical protein